MKSRHAPEEGSGARARRELRFSHSRALFIVSMLLLSASCGDTVEAPCGNGRLDPGEQCDDGNTEDGDGCSSICRFEPSSICGNGVVEGFEECDDGNDVEGDGCDTNCRFSCRANAECNDGNFCNGTEVCELGTHRCVLGAPPPDEGTDCGSGSVCLHGACRPRCFDVSDCEVATSFCAGEASCTEGACLQIPEDEGTRCALHEEEPEAGLCVEARCVEARCGDGFCTDPETLESCHDDCGSCGDGFCTESAGETPASCEADCEASCGDGLCTHQEDGHGCYADCGECGDERCEGPEDHETCPSDCDPPPRHCVATYALDPTFHIEDTLEAYYDGVLELPDGQLTLRYEADALDAPKDDGRVEILHLWVRREYEQSHMMAFYISWKQTTLNLYAPRCNGVAGTEPWNPPPEVCDDDDNDVPLARGTFQGGLVTWDTCHAHADWTSTSPTAYTPDDASTGPGCLSALRVRGNVRCTPSIAGNCPVFHLQPTDNEVSDVWNQPMHPMTLDASGEHVGFAKTHLPNHWRARHFLAFEGQRTALVCDP